MASSKLANIVWRMMVVRMSSICCTIRCLRSGASSRVRSKGSAGRGLVGAAAVGAAALADILVDVDPSPSESLVKHVDVVRTQGFERGAYGVGRLRVGGGRGDLGA